MLSWSLVLKRINAELLVGDTYLEKTDEEIIDYLKSVVLIKFSTYFPAKNSMPVNLNDSSLKVENKKNEFYLIEPDGRQIISVIDVITNMSDRAVLGHPLFGPYSYNDVPEYLLSSYMANNAHSFSPYNKSIEFLPPNKLRISPNVNAVGNVTVLYERLIDEDLYDVPADVQEYFIEMCIGFTMQLIGRLRKKYSTISSPYGEIQLDGESLYNEGTERINKLIDVFEQKTIPNITMDRG